MILRSISIFCIFLLGFAGPVFSISPEETTQVRMVINLMDYISKDYVMAVKDGAVINEFEFAEMQEFAADAQSYYQKLTDQNTISKTDNLTAGFVDLNTLILEKASPAEVAAQAGMLRDAFVEMKLVSLAPNKWPNLENGHNLFQAQCASCHGTEGMGDGPAGAALEPSPTNFHDQEVINNISPLQAFNTITLGIEGTAMVSYNHLSQEEIWDLAFYVLSLQHKGQSTEQANNLDLESIATLSNHKLKAQNPEIDLVAVRTKAPASKEDALSIARDYLSMSQKAASANDFEKAKVAFEADLGNDADYIINYLKASAIRLYIELQEQYGQFSDTGLFSIQEIAEKYFNDTDFDTSVFVKLEADKKEVVKKPSKPKNKPKTSFGYLKDDSEWLSKILSRLQLSIDLLDAKTDVKDLHNLLVAKDFKGFQKKIYIDCKTTEFKYVIKRLQPHFKNMTPTLIESTGLFYTKLGKPLTAQNLYTKSKAPLKKEIIDNIFKQIQ